MFRSIYVVAVFLTIFTVSVKAEDLNIVDFRSSDNSFQVFAPGDMKLENVIYVKDTPEFAIYDAPKSKWFDFIIADKAIYFVQDNKIDGIRKFYKDIISTSSYKIVDVFEIKQDKKLIGVRFVSTNIKVSNKQPKHFKFVDVYEGPKAYYVVQLRDKNNIPPNWLHFAFCLQNKCKKNVGQKILEIPKEFSVITKGGG